MTVKQTKRKFKGGVARNAAKQARGPQFGYLNLERGMNIFKEEPKSRIDLDIIPYEVTSENHLDRDDEYGTAVPGEIWYKKPYLLHRSIGPSSDAVVCPATDKQPCPICEYRQQLLNEGMEWDDEMVRSLKPSKRNLYVVVPIGNKNYPEEPHIWDISQFLFQEKLNEEIGENEEYESFPDLEDGYTLRIRFSEESLGSNKFADTSRIDFVDRKKPYPDSLIDEVPNLDEVLAVLSYDALQKMFYGGLSAAESAEEEEEDIEYEEEDEVVPARRKGGRKGRQHAPNENSVSLEDDDIYIEDEEDEEEPVIEEEEVVEDVPVTPKRTRKTAPKTKAKDECPHGGTFGEDFELLDECDNCDKWEECMDVSP